MGLRSEFKKRKIDFADENYCKFAKQDCDTYFRRKSFSLSEKLKTKFDLVDSLKIKTE